MTISTTVLSKGLSRELCRGKARQEMRKEKYDFSIKENAWYWVRPVQGRQSEITMTNLRKTHKN